MKELLTCCYELMEIELRAQHTDQLFTLLHMAERIDLKLRRGIIEERENNDPDFIQDPDTGQMQGSRPSGGDDNTASGGLNPDSKKAQEHADRYYESVRHMTTDTKKISEATGIKKEKIDKIKNHVFIQEHDLVDGRKRFGASYDMAQSWQRLTSGKGIQEKDMVLLKHEYMELRLMEKGLTQDEAHIIASKRYNYAKYCE